MAKYLKKEKRRPILIVLICIALFFALLIGVVFAFVWSKLDKITYADEIEDSYLATDSFDRDLDSNDVITPEADQDEDLVIEIEGLDTHAEPPTVPDTEVQTDQNVLNILLIGTDERTTKYSKNARADSMILVSINKDLHSPKPEEEAEAESDDEEQAEERPRRRR